MKNKNTQLDKTLDKALNKSHRLLRQFAKDADFQENIATAFGAGADASSFRKAWRSPLFNDIPTIEIRKSSEINGANGAFSIDTDKIYLSEDLFKGPKNIKLIAGVLIEEYGHYVDSKINVTDAAGDEGAIFSALVQGQTLTTQQLSAMRAEDDHATITMDSITIEIEQQFEDRRFNEVTFIGTHNSHVNLTDGFTSANQYFSVTGQLEGGVRSLNFDLYDNEPIWGSNYKGIYLYHGAVAQRRGDYRSPGSY